MSDVKKMAETAAKKAEVSKKLDSAQRKLKRETDMLENITNRGQDTGIKAIDVKYAAKEVARLQKEFDRLG